MAVFNKINKQFVNCYIKRGSTFRRMGGGVSLGMNGLGAWKQNKQAEVEQGFGRRYHRPWTHPFSFIHKKENEPMALSSSSSLNAKSSGPLQTINFTPKFCQVDTIKVQVRGIPTSTLPYKCAEFNLYTQKILF